MTNSQPTGICNVENQLVLRFFAKDTFIIENWIIKKCNPNSCNECNVYSSKKYPYKFIGKNIIHIDNFLEFGNFLIQDKKNVGLKEEISSKERYFGEINFDEFDYNSWIALPIKIDIKKSKIEKKK